MKKRNLTIRKFFTFALIASLSILSPKIAQAKVGILDKVSSGVNSYSLNLFDFSNTIVSAFSETTGTFTETLNQVSRTSVDVLKETGKNVIDVKNLAKNVIDNTKKNILDVKASIGESSEIITKNITDKVDIQSASVASDLNSGLEKVYGFAIDKTANVFVPFFVKKENKNSSLAVTNLDTSLSKSAGSKDVDENKTLSNTPLIKFKKNDAPVQNVNSVNTSSNTSSQLIQNIITRLNQLEINSKAGTVIQNNIQNIYNTYSAGGGSYSVPADTTQSTNASIASALAPITNQVTQLLTVSSSNIFSSIIATSTATSTFVGPITSDSTITASAFFGDGSNLTGITSFSTSTTRGVFSNTATGLLYDDVTGITSLTSGYNIPLTASTTEWASKVSSQWTTSGSNVYFNTGNVGIGTTTPGYSLTVAGDINFTGALRANGDAGTAGMVLLSNGSSAPTWVATSTLGISASPAGSDTYLQFNDGGIFGADSGLSYNKITDTLTSGVFKTLASSGSVTLTSVSTTTAYSNIGGTGDRRALITVTTTITGLNGTPDYLVNGNVTDNYFYWTAQSASGKYLRFDFGTAYSPIITEAKWYQDISSSQGVWQWQGSNDASSWTSIGSTFTFGGSATQTQTELSGNTTAYRYYQLLGVSGSLSGSPYEQEIEFKIAQTLDYSSIKTLGSAGGHSGLFIQDGGAAYPTRIMGNLILDQGVIYNSRPLVSSQWITSSNDIYFPLTNATGNVGIGRSPTSGYRLDIEKTARIKSDTSNYPAEWTWTNSSGNSFRIGIDSPSGPVLGTANAAYISLANASAGLIIFDNSTERYRFQRDGKLGIGTTTPGYSLTVAGDINFTGALRANGDAGTAGMVLLSNGSSAPTWVATSTLGISGGSSLSGGVNGYLSRWTSSSELSTGLLLDNGTVAGVNATSSSYTFNVQGSSGVSPFNVASSTGTSLFSVLANGNVGIGTSNPAAKLDVISTSNTKARIGYSSTDSSSAPTSIAGSYYLRLGGMEYGANSYRLLGFGYNDLSIAGNQAPAYIGYQEISASGYTNGDLIFGTRSTSGAADVASERMRINYLGNVGIGTTTPGYKLTVTGTTSVQMLNFDTNRTGLASGIIMTLDDTSLLKTSTSTAAGTMYFGYGAGPTPITSPVSGFNTGIGYQSMANTGITYTNNTALGYQSMYSVAGSNNTAIGYKAFASTTSTFSSLNTAVGSLALGAKFTTSTSQNTAIGYSAGGALTSGDWNTFLGSNAGLNLTKGTSNIMIGMGAYAASTTGSNQLNIGSLIYGTGLDGFNGTLSAGKIGIGTTTPSATFAITGSGTNDIFRIASSTNAAFFSVGSAGTFAGHGKGFEVRAGASGVGFRTTDSTGSTPTTSLDGGNGLLLSRNHRIGWGSGFSATSDDIALYRSTVGVLEVTNGSSGTWRDLIVRNLSLGTTSTSTTLTLQGGAGKDVVDFASSTGISLFRITQAGNIGIGTTTPVFPLDVYSTVSSTQTYGYLNSTGAVGTAGPGASDYSIRTQGRILAQEFNAVSDARLKDVQFDLDSAIALDAINKLQPVSFTWKNNPTGQPVLGFLAQDVELAIPNAVSRIATGIFPDQRELSYNQIVAVAIGAIKEIKIQLDAVKEKISAVASWFGSDGDRFNVKGMVCVDDVCVSKDQFKQMLINSGSVMVIPSAPGAGGDDTVNADVDDVNADTNSSEGDTNTENNTDGSFEGGSSTNETSPEGDTVIDSVPPQDDPQEDVPPPVEEVAPPAPSSDDSSTPPTPTE